jgi:hypothetical protein
MNKKILIIIVLIILSFVGGYYLSNNLNKEVIPEIVQPIDYTLKIIPKSEDNSISGLITKINLEGPMAKMTISTDIANLIEMEKPVTSLIIEKTILIDKENIQIRQFYPFLSEEESVFEDATLEHLKKDDMVTIWPIEPIEEILTRDDYSTKQILIVNRTVNVEEIETEE